MVNDYYQKIIEPDFHFLKIDHDLIVKFITSNSEKDDYYFLIEIWKFDTLITTFSIVDFRDDKYFEYSIEHKDQFCAFSGGHYSNKDEFERLVLDCILSSMLLNYEKQNKNS